MPRPPSFPRPLIAERARFSGEDWALILKRRRPHTRLGFAYQLAFLRLTGRLPHQQPLEIAPDLLHYVALQLGHGPESAVEKATEEIGRYAGRQPTISAHAEEIKAHLGYRAFESADVQAALVAYLEIEVEHGVAVANRQYPTLTRENVRFGSARADRERTGRSGAHGPTMGASGPRDE